MQEVGKNETSVSSEPPGDEGPPTGGKTALILVLHRRQTEERRPHLPPGPAPGRTRSLLYPKCTLPRDGRGPNILESAAGRKKTAGRNAAPPPPDMADLAVATRLILSAPQARSARAARLHGNQSLCRVEEERRPSRLDARMVCLMTS